MCGVRIKEIIELSCRGSIFGAIAEQIAGPRNRRAPDYRLSFESAHALFADVTPGRLDLLDTLRRAGPNTVYALAKFAERNYPNIHTAAARLAELGLLSVMKTAPFVCHLMPSRSCLACMGGSGEDAHSTMSPNPSLSRPTDSPLRPLSISRPGGS